MLAQVANQSVEVLEECLNVIQPVEGRVAPVIQEHHRRLDPVQFVLESLVAFPFAAEIPARCSRRRIA
jgi:hypothetical protein